MLANISDQKLYSVNCHMHSEASDFLGGLRPVRKKVFFLKLLKGFGERKKNEIEFLKL